MPAHRPLRHITVALALAALTACGSTVQQQTLVGPQAPTGADGLAITEDASAAGDGLGAGALDGGAGTGGSTTGGAPSTSGGGISAGGFSGGTSASGAGAPGAATASAAAVPAAAVAKPASNARGVTATTIKIGLEYIKGADDARKNMGFEGVTSGDQKRQLDILVAHMNKTGGMAGRKVVPVFHAYEASGGGNNNSNEQAACATFAEDNEVFLVISAINHSEIFMSCLTKVGTPYISAPGLTITDDEVFRRYPLHVELNAVSLSKQGEMFGKPLADTGYYDKGAKIGLLTFDQPNFQRAVKNHLKPALQRIGLALTDEVALAYPQSTSGQGALAAAISNAVLRFRQNGVTHVLITDVSALTTVLFAQAASNQGYYPRYGWLSPNGGQAAADLISDKRALEGAVELGWYPSIDLNAANQDVIPAGAKKCADLFRANGYQPQSRNEETVLQLQCEIFFFSQRAMTQTSELTAQSFVTALRGISGSQPPASTYKIDLKGAPAGAAAYRVQRWKTDCRCFKPEDGLLPLR